MDSILWVLLWPHVWILRRLRVEGGIRPISPEELEPLLQVRALNDDADFDRFCLICDLTTTCQLGDIVISQWIPSRNVIKNVVAELKVGATNVLLHKRLHGSGTVNVDEAIDGIAEELGEKAARQAARMVRQERRLENFKRVIASVMSHKLQ